MTKKKKLSGFHKTYQIITKYLNLKHNLKKKTFKTKISRTSDFRSSTLFANDRKLG